MNGKQSKKMRKEARRIYENTMKEMAEFHSRFLKPKPKWVPMFLWLAGLRIFVKIKKS